MNKEDFMKELKYKLKDSDYGTVSEIINDYEEYFAHGLLEGKTEEEICREIGTPKQIIDNLVDQGVLKLPRDKRNNKDTQENNKEYEEYKNEGYIKSNSYNVSGIIGIIILNFFVITMIVLPIGGTIVTVGVGFLLAIIPTLIGAIACLVMGLTLPFYAVISAAAFMILVDIGIYFLIKLIIPLVRTYIKWNMKVARG